MFSDMLYQNLRQRLFAGLLSLTLVWYALTPADACATEGEETAGSEIVTCADGFLKVDAKDIRPEDLMKEIGEKCGMKVVVLGEAFAETPVSIKMQRMPLRRGIERVLRNINVVNYVAHFPADDAPGRVVELYIVGKKGGEKQLTAGTRPAPPPPQPPDQPPRQEPPQDRREEKKAVREELTRDETAKIQENFLKIMDEVLKNQEDGEEPDPGEILKLFKEAVPPDMQSQIPPEVLEELEKLEAMKPPKR